MCRRSVQFSAAFLPGSSRDFRVTPSSGFLPPVGSAGKLITVSFTPTSANSKHTARLTIQVFTGFIIWSPRLFLIDFLVLIFMGLITTCHWYISHMAVGPFTEYSHAYVPGSTDAADLRGERDSPTDSTHLYHIRQWQHLRPTSKQRKEKLCCSESSDS